MAGQILDDDIELSHFNELDTWRDIVTSQGWTLFKDLLSDHIDYLNNQALIALGNKNNELAYEYRIRALECKTILDIVDRRLSELKKG